MVGALIGLGIEGEDGAEAGARGGRSHGGSAPRPARSEKANPDPAT
jgi:hypothetical protein